MSKCKITHELEPSRPQRGRATVRSTAAHFGSRGRPRRTPCRAVTSPSNPSGNSRGVSLRVSLTLPREAPVPTGTGSSAHVRDTSYQTGRGIDVAGCSGLKREIHLYGRSWIDKSAKERHKFITVKARPRPAVPAARAVAVGVGIPHGSRSRRHATDIAYPCRQRHNDNPGVALQSGSIADPGPGATTVGRRACGRV